MCTIKDYHQNRCSSFDAFQSVFGLIVMPYFGSAVNDDVM